MTDPDAIVVGSGPNGLAAALRLAAAGRRVLVVESAMVAGGGLRTAELTLPGFRHDVCATILPLALASPAFRAVDVDVSWAQPPIAFGHPLPDGTAATAVRSIDDTARGLGVDGPRWRASVGGLAGAGPALLDALLSPMRPPAGPIARSPRAVAELVRFGILGLPGASTTGRLFRTPAGRALFAGLAAHSVLDHSAPLTSGYGLVLGALAHAVGWPAVRGGSQVLADALIARLRALGGEIVLGERVTDLGELPRAPVILLDLAPRGVLAVAGDRLPPRYRDRLARFRHAPGVFKIDHALAGPVPWRDPVLAGAGTVHLGGTAEEIAAAEREVARGRHPARPYVIVVQASAADPTRAPAGQHTLYAYCHVPHGSPLDRTAAIEDQIERFAPGFRERVLARHVMGPAALEAHDANLVGGDLTGGSGDWRQFVARPVLSATPWRTPVPGLYLCSASTPPGGGVHGMGGWTAAGVALRDVERSRRQVR